MEDNNLTNLDPDPDKILILEYLRNPTNNSFFIL